MTYTYIISGGNSYGKTNYGTRYSAYILKNNRYDTCLVGNLQMLDMLVSLGVQPSQLILESELHYTNTDPSLVLEHRLDFLG